MPPPRPPNTPGDRLPPTEFEEQPSRTIADTAEMMHSLSIGVSKLTYYTCRDGAPMSQWSTQLLLRRTGSGGEGRGVSTMCSKELGSKELGSVK